MEINADERPHILLFTGDGARGPGISRLSTIITQHCRLTTLDQIPNSLNLENFDLVLFPGGSSVKQYNGIGPDGITYVKDFVNSGGGYVGICAGAFLGSYNTGSATSGLNLLQVAWSRHKLFKDGEDLRGDIVLTLNDCASRWYIKDEEFKDEVECHYHNGAIFPPYGLPKGVTILATIKEGTGGKSKAAKMRRKATIISGKYGQGNVILCGPHPEQTIGLEDFTWKMIARALPDKYQ